MIMVAKGKFSYSQMIKDNNYIETIDGTNVMGIKVTYKTLPKNAKPFKSYYDIDLNMWTQFFTPSSRKYLVKSALSKMFR